MATAARSVNTPKDVRRRDLRPGHGNPPPGRTTERCSAGNCRFGARRGGSSGLPRTSPATPADPNGRRPQGVADVPLRKGNRGPRQGKRVISAGVVREDGMGANRMTAVVNRDSAQRRPSDRPRSDARNFLHHIADRLSPTAFRRQHVPRAASAAFVAPAAVPVGPATPVAEHATTPPIVRERPPPNRSGSDSHRNRAPQCSRFRNPAPYPEPSCSRCKRRCAPARPVRSNMQTSAHTGFRPNRASGRSGPPACRKDGLKDNIHLPSAPRP